MSLSTRPWERWVEKDPWPEFRYVGENQLLVLAEGLELYRGSSPPLHLDLENSARIGCSLAPFGSSFTGDGQSIWALESQTPAIRQWDLASGKVRQTLPLTSPATHLQIQKMGPLSWLSWISQSAEGQPLIYVRTAEELRSFWSFDAVPYAFEWHPERPLCLALLVARTSLPWEESELRLANYRLEGSVPSLVHEKSLVPPGLGPSPSCLEAHFSPDGETVLGLWRSGEWYQLWSYQLSSQRWMQLSFGTEERALPRRRVDSQSFLPLAGGQILSLSQARGFFRLDSFSLREPPLQPAQSFLDLAGFTSLRQLRGSPSHQAFCLVGASAQETPTLLEWKRREGQGWTLTEKRKKFTARSSAGLEPEALSWPSADGQMVQGLLYRDRRRSGPLPLLLPIHGGPTEQVVATWPMKAQAFVQRGYAVLYINYRGSWGYGYSYQQALAGRWGELDIADIVASIKPLAAAGWIDPRRVGLWGGGVGGSTVLRLLQRFPKLFRAAIAVYPICDLYDYAQRCGFLSRAEIGRALGSLDRATLEARSPLYANQKVMTPLALFHGGRDPLIPLEQIEALAADLSQREIPIWLKIYAEEGHGWRMQETVDDYNCRVESFLARFLRRDSHVAE